MILKHIHSCINPERVIVDSFLLYVPLTHIDKLPYELEQESHIYSVDSVTGEVLNVSKANFKDGNFYARNMIFPNGKRYISFAISSKLLPTNQYHRGITEKDVFKYLHSRKDFSFDFHFLEESIITDIDLAVDFIYPYDLYKKDLLYMYNVDNRTKIFRTDRNTTLTGIQYNVRELSSNRMPFGKIYDKIKELEKGNETHLIANFAQNTKRCELTIKNTNHFEYIRRRIKSIVEFKNIDILKYPELRTEIYLILFNQIFSEVPTDVVHEDKEKEIFSPTDVIYIEFIKAFREVYKLYDFDSFFAHVVTRVGNYREWSSVERSRLKKRLKNLYSQSF